MENPIELKSEKSMFKRKEKSITSIFNNLNSASICIDCGANVGDITKQMSAKGGIVYAFEPNPFAFDVLKKKFQGHENIYLFNQGVWDKNTTMKLYLHEHSNEDEVYWSTGSSILEYKGNVLKDKFVEIEIIDLVDFIKNLAKKIDILKIDIEGAECELLEKIISTKIYKNIKHIFVETHDHKIPELKEKTDAIRKLIKYKKIKNINLNWI